MDQLALNVRLHTNFSFENFYIQNANVELVALLHDPRLMSFSQLFIWGEMAAGKTHLLQAYCHAAQSKKMTVFYLPLKRYAQYGAKVLVGLSRYEALVIDDVDAVFGDREWEELLYAVINERSQRGQLLLFSAREDPRESGCSLADLRSRLMWGVHYRLMVLAGAELSGALPWLATQRGFKLPESVLEYLCKQFPLTITCQSRILEHLDRQSMQNRRKITRQFVHQILKDFGCE